MAKDAVEKYLKGLGEIYRRGGGVGEESYYGTLESLLNEIGRKLEPKPRPKTRPKLAPLVLPWFYFGLPFVS